MVHLRHLKRWIYLILLLIFCLGGIAGAQAESELPIVRIGILAKRGEAKALEQWSSTGRYLKVKNPTYDFRIIPLGFDQIYSAVQNREIDFVLANSAYYVALEHKYGVEAIATMENGREGQGVSQFGGVIFRLASRTDIKEDIDLSRRSFVAVDENSFGGYYIALFHLLQHGIDPHKESRSVTFAGTHDAVVQAVLEGQADIGTVRTGILERMALEGKINLADFTVFQHGDAAGATYPFLLTTEVYPEWPMARLSHVKQELSDDVTLALMMMTRNDQAAIDAKIHGWTVPYNYLPVHKCLMALRVEPYDYLNDVHWKDFLRQYWSLVTGFIFILGIVVIFSVFLGRAKRDLERQLVSRKETEKTLRQFKITLDQIYDSVFVFDPDSLVFFYVNQSALLHVGYTRDELLAMTPLDIMLEYSEHDLREILQPLLSGKVEFVSLETAHWHKDNFLVPVDVHFQYVSVTEGVGRFVAVVRDITAQKKEEEQFRKLFESSMDASMIANEEGFLDCNQRTLEIFGYDHKKDFLKLNPGDVSPPTQPNGESSYVLASEKIKEAMANKVAFFDWSHKRQNGSIFPSEVMLSPFERDGEMVIHAIVRDVTERKNAEKQQGKLQAKLLHAQKLESVGQLAAGIAHEINTPTQYVAHNITFLAEVIDDVQEIIDQFIQTLAIARKKGILSKNEIEQSERLLDELGWDELKDEIPDAINQSQEGLKRVTSIVQAMKEFSHPGSKEKADTDINKVITTTLTVARNEWKYVAELDTKLSEDLPLIPCLSDEIGQVVLNMIVNGAHAIAEKLGENSEKKGRILIQTSHDAECVEIMITDTGSGIPEEIISRIFDPFFTTKKVGKGTGQGLAISHDVITEKHGGTLTCESREGVGTTFIIRLPLM